MDDRNTWLSMAVGAAIGSLASIYMYSKVVSSLEGESSSQDTNVAAATLSRVRRAHRAKDRNNAELLEEQLSRNRLYFGNDGQQALQDAFVVVVGLGGVGSHAAHMLLRAGVGRLRLVDFDNLTLSSLNRHAVGTRDDVGRPKVEVCQYHFEDVFPNCQVEALNVMFEEKQADMLLDGRPDFVVDAIDDINTKTDLVLACNRLGLRVISAMGAGAKSDPTKVLIGNITDPVNDPLAAKLRSFIRNRLASRDDPEQTAIAFQQCVDNFHVVYSYEAPQAKLAELSEEQVADPDAYGALPNFRLRVLPVLGTMPAIIGMAAASFVLCELANKKFVPRKVEPVSQAFAHKLQNRLVRHEAKEFENSGETATTIADQMEVAYVIESVWRSRSAFQLYDRTRHATRNLTLTRFDRSKPALPYNLILLTDTEARWLDEETKATGSLAKILVDGNHHHEAKCAPNRRILKNAQHILLELESIWQAGNKEISDSNDKTTTTMTTNTSCLIC